MTIRTLFVTRLYEAAIDKPDLLDELDHSIRTLADEDRAGRAWSKEHGYPGYTSYASLGDLPIAELPPEVGRQHNQIAFTTQNYFAVGKLWIIGASDVPVIERLLARL